MIHGPADTLGSTTFGVQYYITTTTIYNEKSGMELGIPLVRAVAAALEMVTSRVVLKQESRKTFALGIGQVDACR